MSYEGKMLTELNMPPRKEVEQALLIVLFKHNGAIKEFGSGEEIVDEIADGFGLNKEQRTAFLETIYRKENRVKKSLLWHRLLFRAADNLAKEKLISRPTQTMKLTSKREWMLTESGFDKALKLLNIPAANKDFLLIKSYEVQKIVTKLKETRRPENYDPFDKKKRTSKTTRETTLRARGFRQAIIEAYDYKCAVCGLKIPSPDSSSWEVEAAHIVPHRAMGKDDIWNGLALCHLHHWAFDVGWFTLLDDYRVQFSAKVNSLPVDFGRIGSFEILKFSNNQSRIQLPSRTELYPHYNAISWHRQNIFTTK
jgi:hypothetical protein